MRLRRLGRTGLMVSCVGFGGMGFINRHCQKDARTIINVALDEGINFIDTARSYYNSEFVIGEAIKGRRKECYLATKTLLRSAKMVRKEIEASLRSFQIAKIELYQLHNIQHEYELKKVLAFDGALKVLKEAKKAGKIDYIGVTSHHPEMMVKCIETGEFDTVQIPLNPIEKEYIEKILPVAEKHDTGIIIMKPLAGGVLTNPELILKFILGYNISTVIPGCSTVEQVKLDTRAGKAFIPLSEKEKKDLFKEVENIEDVFCRRCRYCERVCPAGLLISDIFRCERYLSLDVTYGQREYRKLCKQAKECTGCGECEKVCPYNLSIKGMLKDAHQKLTKWRYRKIIVDILKRVRLYERVKEIYFSLGLPIPKK